MDSIKYRYRKQSRRRTKVFCVENGIKDEIDARYAQPKAKESKEY